MDVPDRHQHSGGADGFPDDQCLVVGGNQDCDISWKDPGIPGPVAAMLPLHRPAVRPWSRKRVGTVDAGSDPVGQRPPLEDPECAPAQRRPQCHPTDVLFVAKAHQAYDRPEDGTDSQDKDNVYGYHSAGAPIVSYMA